MNWSSSPSSLMEAKTYARIDFLVLDLIFSFALDFVGQSSENSSANSY